ncbi:MAG: EamA family transporter [archaeon]|nr:EamA family transporter [archaeon]
MVNREQSVAIALIVGAGTLWGTMGVASRYVLDADVTGYQIVFVRSLITSLFLFVTFYFIDPSKLKIELRDIWMFIGSGVFGLTTFNLCYFQALPTLSLSMATVLLYTAPVYVTIISLVVFNEKMNRYKLLALIAAVFGCIFTTGVLGDADGDVTGIFFGILAGFFYSLYTVFGAIALKKYHPVTFTAYTFLFAALFTFPTSDIASLGHLMMNDILIPVCLVLIGVLFTLVPFFMYSRGLRDLDPSVAAVLAYTEPMVATIIGFLVYGENITYGTIVGILLILLAIVLLSYGDRIPDMIAEWKSRRQKTKV